MRKSFSKLLGELVTRTHQRVTESTPVVYTTLRELSTIPFPKSGILTTYFDTLLFLQAYPFSTEEYALVEKELQRITSFVKVNQNQFHSWLQNTGLPFSSMNTRFSHDALKWLQANPDLKVEIDSMNESYLPLHAILYITLPTAEKHIAETGMENNLLLDALLIPKKNRLTFLISEFTRFDQQPQLKDTLFDQLGMYVNVRLAGANISKAKNRIHVDRIFYHEQLLHYFDYKEVIHSPLPDPYKQTKQQRHQTIQAVKMTMLLTVRETDPTTYMESESLRLYTLERGVSIAIYGMEELRQLPFESYIGYTVFKNGLPVSYGGAWIFGQRAVFGINIFETFRKGESGYIMAQLLRVFKNRFGVTYFEVEPYQYGLDNPEGITSGAFWFYYKYGFRPTDKVLLKKAQQEAEKIKNKKGYRTSQKTLIEFTGSTISLQLGKKTPLSVASITSKITRMIGHTYGGNRALAERTCIAEFKSKTGLKRANPSSPALSEIALWAKAMQIKDQKKLMLMADMVSTKPKDLYAYQGLLLQLLSED